MKHLRAAAQFAAAAIECVEILCLGAACLVVIALTPDEDTQAELSEDDAAPDDDPCRWPEFRANVGVHEAGVLLSGIERLRATDDVLGLVAR